MTVWSDAVQRSWSKQKLLFSQVLLSVAAVVGGVIVYKAINNDDSLEGAAKDLKGDVKGKYKDAKGEAKGTYRDVKHS